MRSQDPIQDRGVARPLPQGRRDTSQHSLVHSDNTERRSSRATVKEWRFDYLIVGSNPNAKARTQNVRAFFVVRTYDERPIISQRICLLSS